MGRLPKFNYRSPFFYMVTLKKKKGLPAFSRITGKNEADLLLRHAASSIRELRRHPEAFLENGAVTEALRAAIVLFANNTSSVVTITPVAIMPDHIHFLVRIRDTGDQMPLGSLVVLLMRKLARAYWQALGKPAAEGPVQPVFEREWHDWIVKRKGRLEGFNTYILENPFRAWRRQRSDSRFLTCRTVQFLGRTWFAFGNEELL